jgi:hypothetical protein
LGRIGDDKASILITEGFKGAWRSAAQESNSGTALGTGSSILLTFTGVPDKVNLGLAIIAQDEVTGASVAQNATITDASGDNDVLVTYTGGDLNDIGEIQIDITVTLDSGTTSVPAGSITVNANLAPQGAALSAVVGAENTPTETGGYPRYSSAATAELTVVTIAGASTNLLIPFVTYDGLAGGFDTGISIANTTADPFTGVAGSGTISFWLFPRTATGAGTMISLTTGTGTTPGVGLATDGTLASGGTWSGLLSELLTAANETGAFTGYIFMKANFILGHGTSFVTNFSTFTAASPMLVLDSVQSAARTGFEALSM